MAVLLIAEISDGELSMDATAKAVTAAKQLGDVTILAAGSSAAAAGEAAAKIDGVSKVLVAEDEMLSGCQVHRFVVLHKELDADDGELTRTRKVRRKIIEEKYADIIAALYDGSDKVSTETEVTYEDGRKGSIKATLEIRDAAVQPVSRRMAAE